MESDEEHGIVQENHRTLKRMHIKNPQENSILEERSKLFAAGEAY